MGSEFLSAAAEARKVLDKYDLNNLPIDVEKLCRDLKIPVHYVDFSSVERKVGKKISGAIQKDDGAYTILVNEDESDVRIRFTIAHELGHYLLGHLGTDKTNLNREYHNIKPVHETEADMFAARLLAPACVLWGINAHTAEQIASVCNISPEAAKIRSERMELLRKRNKFLTSPLEQQVYNQFADYIKNNRL